MISYDLWLQRFAGAEPVGYLLRDVLPDRWVRFHNLPEGRRCPEDAADIAMLLDRHNTVLMELTTAGRPVALLTTEFSTATIPAGRDEAWQTLDPHAVPWRSVAMHHLNSEPWPDAVYWHVYASEHAWEPGRFDQIIQMAACDELHNILLLDTDGRWVIWPYDGGMDVITDTPSARDTLRDRHSDWLP